MGIILSNDETSLRNGIYDSAYHITTSDNGIWHSHLHLCMIDTDITNDGPSYKFGLINS